MWPRSRSTKTRAGALRGSTLTSILARIWSPGIPGPVGDRLHSGLPLGGTVPCVEALLHALHCVACLHGRAGRAFRAGERAPDALFIGADDVGPILAGPA